MYNFEKAGGKLISIFVVEILEMCPSDARTTINKMIPPNQGFKSLPGFKLDWYQNYAELWYLFLYCLFAE